MTAVKQYNKFLTGVFLPGLQIKRTIDKTFSACLLFCAQNVLTKSYCLHYQNYNMQSIDRQAGKFQFNFSFV